MLPFILLPLRPHTVSTAAVCLVSGLRHLIMQWGRLQKWHKAPKKEADRDHRPTHACTCKNWTKQPEPSHQRFGQRQNMIDNKQKKRQLKEQLSPIQRLGFTDTTCSHRHPTSQNTNVIHLNTIGIGFWKHMQMVIWAGIHEESLSAPFGSLTTGSDT